MKNFIFGFCIFLIFSSCVKNEEIEIDHIKGYFEIMNQDSVSIEFFDALSLYAKILAEEEINLYSYTSIINSYSGDPCHVPMGVFAGNRIQKKFSIADCRMRKAKNELNYKFPFVTTLNKKDKSKLFKLLIPPSSIDHRKVRKKTMNRILKKFIN